MRLLTRILCIVVLLFAAQPASPRETTSLRGWVSDEACGTLHAKPGREDCVRKCRRGGAAIGHPEWTPQRLVLISDSDKQIWVVENPEMLDGREGQHVDVQGAFNAEKHSLHIEKVAEVAPKDKR